MDVKAELSSEQLSKLDLSLQDIARKIYDDERISSDEAIKLFKVEELGFVMTLANYIKTQLHGDKVYYNKNLHLEPSNICVYNCKFCTYSKKMGEHGSYENSLEDMLAKIEKIKNQITEVHIVGGAHPNYDLDYYCEFFRKIKQVAPELTIKALTAIELQFIIKKAGISLKEGLKILIDCGLGAIPGGGAEIFNESIRKQVCKEKANADEWLTIHEEAHRLGLKSNATMLFGHIESIEDRIDHLNRLRDLQDKTSGFNAFIPLKFRNFGRNQLAIEETNQIDVIKTFAISRIFLDNIPHIKAYWPDVGVETASLLLSCGADDFDGTVQDTKIYSEENKNSLVLSENAIVDLIAKTGLTPVERDTNYKVLKVMQ